MMRKKIRVTRKQYERIILTYRIGGFIAIVGLLIGFSFLVGKPIEFVLIFLPYFVTKGLYARQYHSASLKHCLLLSIGIFAFAVLITVPKEYSICCSLFVGLIIAFASCKVGEVQVKLKAYAELTTSKPFNVDTCTEMELLERCNELHLSQENMDLAVEFFIRKTKQSILADKYCVDEKSIQMRKRRFRAKLNKK